MYEYAVVWEETAFELGESINARVEGGWQVSHFATTPAFVKTYAFDESELVGPRLYVIMQRVRVDPPTESEQTNG